MRVSIQVNGNHLGNVDVELEDDYSMMRSEEKISLDVLLIEAVRKVRLAYEIEETK